VHAPRFLAFPAPDSGPSRHNKNELGPLQIAAPRSFLGKQRGRAHATLSPFAVQRVYPSRGEATLSPGFTSVNDLSTNRMRAAFKVACRLPADMIAA
jgi:hypothetical protein